MVSLNSADLESSLESPCKGKRVIICEDHPATRFGFREACRSIGCEVIAEIEKGAEAIELCQEHKPDLLILDQFLADKVNGPEVHRQLRRSGLPTKVFVITSYCDSAIFFDWINQPDGPDGVLEKNTSLYQLRMAIAQVLSTNDKYIPASIWRREQAGGQNPLNKLSPHELRLLREIAASGGDRLNVIAVRLGLAPSTARAYMNDIYFKLEISKHTLQAAAGLYNEWIQTGSATETGVLRTDSPL